MIDEKKSMASKGRMVTKGLDVDEMREYLRRVLDGGNFFICTAETNV